MFIVMVGRVVRIFFGVIWKLRLGDCGGWMVVGFLNDIFMILFGSGRFSRSF